MDSEKKNTKTNGVYIHKLLFTACIIEKFSTMVPAQKLAMRLAAIKTSPLFLGHLNNLTSFTDRDIGFGQTSHRQRASKRAGLLNHCM